MGPRQEITLGRFGGRGTVKRRAPGTGCSESLAFSGSPKNRLNHLTPVDRRPFFATAVKVGQLLVVNAQAMQDGGMQIMDVDTVLHGVQAKGIGGPMRDAALDA